MLTTEYDNLEDLIKDKNINIHLLDKSFTVGDYNLCSKIPITYNEFHSLKTYIWLKNCEN